MAFRIKITYNVNLSLKLILIEKKGVLVLVFVFVSCSMCLSLFVSGNDMEDSVTDTQLRFMDTFRRMETLGHSKGTKRTYRAGMVAYENFLRSIKFNQGSRITHELLLCFIAYLTEDLRLAYATIKVYIYAVRDWALENGYKDPTTATGSRRHKYYKFLAGVRRVTRFRKRNRLPLKRKELRLVMHAIARSSQVDSEKILLKAVILIAYYGLLRSSEYTLSRTNADACLRRRDIKFIRDDEDSHISRVKLRLRRTKTSQFDNVYLDIFSTNNEFCPVTALVNYTNINRGLKSKPLFWSLGEPLTAARFRYLFKTLLGSAGLNGKRYSTHSLRSGAATVAADAGVPAWIIQRLGRWRSDCYKIYIKNNKRSIRLAQKFLDI